MGYSPTTNLPFFPLIANCGVTNQKLMKYNIIKDLCLPFKIHICKTHNSFEKETVQRYQKEVLLQTPIQPILLLAKEQMHEQQTIPKTLLTDKKL